jgi:mono/diheme cytochrome c family protein
VRSVSGALTGALLLLGAGGALLGAHVLGDRQRPGFEYMPDMADSLPYDSFAPNPVTRDGQTLLAPVAGTVARGFQPFLYGTGPAEAERAGRELTNPVPASDEGLARGRANFETFCAVCHGQRGAGDGPLVPRIPNPPAYTSDRVRSMPPGQLFHVISRGSGRMPSYAAQIPEHDRWLIVRYVQTLRLAGAARP